MKLLTFNDITIVPAITTRVEHRNQCNPYDDSVMLPLFTAPMSSVINDNNWKNFQQNKINTIIPRNIASCIRQSLCTQTFVAVSLQEFEDWFLNNPFFERENDYFFHICIDIANGHMQKLLDLCKKVKEIYKDQIKIMTGNIANPATYLEYAKVGINYIRCGIGSGNVCTTSANAGIHYPMASLIQRISDFKQMVLSDIKNNGKTEHVVIDEFTGFDIEHVSQYKSVPKIIADGGFNNFDQIIKALALGADYVMIGKLFAMSEEACGDVKSIDNKFYRRYYGMSTKEAQKEFGNVEFKTAEGIEKLVPIEYTLSRWCDNFISYLRSTMSYCDSFNLKEFSNKAIIKEISNNSFNNYYK